MSFRTCTTATSSKTENYSLGELNSTLKLHTLHTHIYTYAHEDKWHLNSQSTSLEVTLHHQRWLPYREITTFPMGTLAVHGKEVDTQKANKITDNTDKKNKQKHTIIQHHTQNTIMQTKHTKHNYTETQTK